MNAGPARNALPPFPWLSQTKPSPEGCCAVVSPKPSRPLDNVGLDAVSFGRRISRDNDIFVHISISWRLILGTRKSRPDTRQY